MPRHIIVVVTSSRIQPHIGMCNKT